MRAAPSAVGSAAWGGTGPPVWVAAGAAVDSLQRVFHDQSEERDIVGIYVDSLPPAYPRPLGAGDAVKLAGEPSVRMDGGAHAEALLFDLP